MKFLFCPAHESLHAVRFPGCVRTSAVSTNVIALVGGQAGEQHVREVVVVMIFHVVKSNDKVDGAVLRNVGQTI